MTSTLFTKRLYALWQNNFLLFAFLAIGISVIMFAEIFDWGEKWPRIGIGLALIGTAVISLAYFGRSVELGRHDIPQPAVYRNETPRSFRLMLIFDILASAVFAVVGLLLVITAM